MAENMHNMLTEDQARDIAARLASAASAGIVVTPEEGYSYYADLDAQWQVVIVSNNPARRMRTIVTSADADTIALAMFYVVEKGKA